MSRLVLTRKLNEQVSVSLDDDTTVLVTVARIDRNQVRLLFDAPTEVKIERPERQKVDPTNNQR
jgi:carbon storage regulator CsrA|tara:strand:+ start:3655 stop:3846 length:192 start_codon:yes stop_codon:yes gene_type:complete